MNFLIGSYSSIRLAGATPRCHVLSDTAHTMSTRGGKRGGGPPPPCQATARRRRRAGT